MTSPDAHRRLLDRVDAALAEHPEFGDAVAVEQRALARLRVGLAALGRRHPVLADRAAAWAAADDEPLRRLLRDPALRTAVEYDLTLAGRGATDPPRLDALLPPDPSDAKDRLARALARPNRDAWPELGDTWVWTGIDEAAGPVEAAMWTGLRSLFPGSGAEAPIEPTEETLTGIRRGATLLTRLLPRTGHGVLRHLGMIGLARDSDTDGSLLSLSGGDGLPATMFVAPELVRDPWDAAGMILHESLHLELFEILRCGELTAVGPNATTPAIPIPWRAVEWSVMRVLFALHVYVHMTLFQQAAAVASPELLAEFGEPKAGAAIPAPTPGRSNDYTASHQRAAYLGEQLERVVPHMVSDYGARFARWLVDVLEELRPGVRDGWAHPEPSPEPAGTAEVARGGPDDRLVPVSPVDAVPLPEQTRLVVACGEPVRLHWLNLSAWTAYALCDGRDRATAAAAYRDSVGGDPDEADHDFATAVAGLAARGLITVESS